MPNARQDEIEWLAGHYYHMYNRGGRRVTIFREERNYLFALTRIRKYCTDLALTLIAYVLMPNHYHFLVRQDKEVPAGLLPQRVFNSYSKAYNKLYQHSGTLFEGRFKTIPVADDAYLRRLCRYIHANPVKDGIVHQLDAWPFSNYLDWVGKRPGKLVDHRFVQEYFGSATHYEASLNVFIQQRRYLDKHFAPLNW